ncbi:MAG: TfoX/Sxy family protein [Candidatus Metalachnospira sp.]|nr:TfoX/Sxy family protein [Candidatus Metalachnospira sp.]
MATTKEYADFIISQLDTLGDTASRKMMGEYVLYYRGKVFGGLYDNRLLVKITEAGKNVIPDAPEEIPYQGAKPMLLVEDVDDKELLNRLISSMYDELPMPKPKKKK